mgnify:CR=1 FL=1
MNDPAHTHNYEYKRYNRSKDVIIEIIQKTNIYHQNYDKQGCLLFVILQVAKKRQVKKGKLDPSKIPVFRVPYNVFIFDF